MLQKPRFLFHVIFGCLVAVSLFAADAASQADGVLEKIGVDRGICVVLGEPNCQLARELAAATDLLVYVQLPSNQDVDNARRAAEAAGLDARQFHVEQGPLSRLHLADNVADAFIAVGDAGRTSQGEALRVLRPRGKALLGARELVKPVPDGLGDWTHPYHGPDNNPVSQDRVIRAPYLTQFFADPRYGPAPQVAVAAGGRMFKAFGNVAWHEREEPYLNTLAAFDGFNGTLLWKRKLPEGTMVHRNTMVATPDTLYVGDDQSCQLIDAATGDVKGEIRLDADLSGGTFWKWMALEDNILYALIGEQELKDPEMRWKRDAHGWPWNQISRGYNQPQQPWGYGRTLLALDPRTKQILWRYREDEPIDARAVCLKNDRLFAFRFGAYLTCLDARTGEVLWRKTKDNAPDLFTTLGEYLPRQGWQTNWRTAAYLKCSADAVYFAGPQLSKLLALSTKDGRILWEHPYDNFQLVLYPDSLYAISGPWGNDLSRKFDPLTGKVLAELPTGRRACTRPTGTSDSILFRAMGGSIRFDLASSRPRWLSPMRPPCQDGVTVANGLLYWWPYTCDCQLNLYGVACVGPAEDFDFRPDPKAADRREILAEGSTDVAALPVETTDWPTFRANNQATVTTEAVIPDTSRVLWQSKLQSAGEVRPTAPVSVADLVFLAGSDGVVRAVDAGSGQPRWRAHTAGEIRMPPTVWQGRALVGSADGWVYALEARTGRRLWRFRAAPAERKIPVYGRLLSTWPAASGVLVEDGTAFVAAGLVNYDGTYVYALDAATGRVQWCNDTSGHLDAAARTGVSVQGHLLAHAGKLYLAGGNAVSPAAYDLRDGRCLNDPAPLALCESTSPRGWELFLMGEHVIACGRPLYAHPDIPVYDHTVTKKILHASAGQRDIVWLDNRQLLCFEPLDRDSLSRCVTDEKIPKHVTQAWGEFKVSQRPQWQYACPGSVALAIGKNAVIVADATKVIALSLETGKPLWAHPLPASPVQWGMAIDREGRVILTLVDGRVLAIGV